MSVIKSFSVGNGDMFYIKHNSENFTVIDCCLTNENEDRIINEIKEESKEKKITRFISTHPDDDHIRGLKKYNEKIRIINFYCVENKAIKDDETEDFKEYCFLRDDKKTFFITKGCERKWMNVSGEDDNGNYIGGAGISILWPKTSNKYFKDVLEEVKNGTGDNNLSPIIKYSVEDSIRVMWFGDLEKDFMEKIKDDLIIDNADIIFAPHHGRDSGKIPKEILDKINPKLVVIGEAPSEYLNYYNGYNRITQNSAGDITFEQVNNEVHIYVSKSNYTVDFLKNKYKANTYGYYIGTLEL